MRLGVTSIFDSNIIPVSEFTLDDFRTIALLIESDNDEQLHDFLISKIESPCNSFDKFYSLLEARIKFVNENIVLDSGKANININLNIWRKLFIDNVKIVKTEIESNGITVIVDYPIKLLYKNFEDFMLDSIYSISYIGKDINFLELCKDDKYKILEKLPLDLIKKIKSYIEDNINYKIVLMESKLGLPEISVNLFDDSVYMLLKTLYNYYTYDNILETIYFLSKRLSDISYLNTRTPRDLEVLIQLYSEEFEKTNQETKSII